MVPEWEGNPPHTIGFGKSVESVLEASYHLIGVRRALCRFGLNNTSLSSRGIRLLQSERPVLKLANDLIHDFDPAHGSVCDLGGSLLSEEPFTRPADRCFSLIIDAVGQPFQHVHCRGDLFAGSLCFRHALHTRTPFRRLLV